MPDRTRLWSSAGGGGGLIQPLGDWIIGEALATAAGWPTHLGRSVNASVAQFRQGDLAAMILRAMERMGVEAESLTAESPRRFCAIGPPSVDDQMMRIEAGGLTIVVEDFGLESSSL